MLPEHLFGENQSAESAVAYTCSKKCAENCDFVSLVQKPTTVASYKEHHAECKSKVYKEEDLSLLFVCSETHAEAALLPFALNDFTFEGYETLSYFLDHQYGQQVAMLQKATLVYHPRIKPHQKTTNPHLWKLKTVKNLTILVQADTHCLWQVAGEFGRYNKQLRKDLAKLQRLPFETVTVVGYRAPQQSEHRHCGPDAQAYEDVAGNLRRDSEGHWDEVAGGV